MTFELRETALQLLSDQGTLLLPPTAQLPLQTIQLISVAKQASGKVCRLLPGREQWQGPRMPKQRGELVARMQAERNRAHLERFIETEGLKMSMTLGAEAEDRLMQNTDVLIDRNTLSKTLPSMHKTVRKHRFETIHSQLA